jgi:LysM repeat protein
VESRHADRRARKIRRTGRHTTPSQVEKVAEKAGKAAPAVAIAGILVAAAPQAHASVASPAKTATVSEQVRTEASTVALVRRDATATRRYTVHSGDSLSTISERFYGTSADWRWIYDANRSKISNPNDIYVGESLTIPYSAPATTASYTAKHAKAKPKAVVLTSSTSPSGTLGCSGLEELWEDAGGANAVAFTAAEIAMAESGGRQYALSPTDDYGYWQINAVHGAEATFNALGNARAAIAISDDGRDWDPWTTYVTGAFEGRC